jgi:hypothetical protein
MELAEEIRRIAKTKHVSPALASGRREFSIAVRDLIEEAKAEGISTVQRTPPFCTSIQTRRFLDDNGIEIVRVDGPAKKRSTTVVVHYRAKGMRTSHKTGPVLETPEERAFRLTEKLRGLMKEEIAAYGGGEAYLRWVRGEDDEAA